MISDEKWHFIFQQIFILLDFLCLSSSFLFLFQNVLLTFYKTFFFQLLKAHQHLSHFHSLQGLADSTAIMLFFTFFYQSFCTEKCWDQILWYCPLMTLDDKVKIRFFQRSSQSFFVMHDDCNGRMKKDRQEVMPGFLVRS